MQERKMATKKEEDKKGEKIKVDEMEVNVKTPPPSKVRPVYHCQICDTSFPSQLDLEEHMKIDHDNKSKRGNGSAI